MTLDRFTQLAETWGGDVGRWPEPERAAAERIAATGEGAAILRAQRSLDEILSAAPQIDEARSRRAALAVLQRIAATETREPESREPWYRRWLQPATLVPVGSLACSALLGIWIAGTLPYHQTEQALAAVDAVFDASALTLWGHQ
ncbi:hypothetical protein [Rhodopseudomonas sp. B29]|uniref:hypothetical protein n=1 Tax=Rhodopseudomonas sp. B29 TaxID=95607 RepID=UPI00034C590D|nr:hypothetical protein [Rhodopseudomonas sp. B29]